MNKVIIKPTKKEALESLEEASISIACCLDELKDVTQQDLEHIQDQIIIIENYFKELNIQTETIKLNGSIELAVKYGVADFILDLVQSGKTLEDNQLYENVVINNNISTIIISSYYAYDVKKKFIKKFLTKGL